MKSPVRMDCRDKKIFSMVSKFVFKLELCAWIVTYPSEGHAEKSRDGFLIYKWSFEIKKCIEIIKWVCSFM